MPVHIFALGAVTPAAAGKDIIPGPIPVKILYVIDGDTLVISAKVWLGHKVETRVRLGGVDTPELKSKCAEERALALQARDFTAAWVKTHSVSLVEIKYGKYAGRVIARIKAPNGEDLGAALLQEGLARAYNGGKRQPWCGT